MKLVKQDPLASMARLGIAVYPATVDETDYEETIEGLLLDALVDIQSGGYDRFLSPLFSWIAYHGAVVDASKMAVSLEERASRGDVSLVALAACFAVECGYKQWSELIPAKVENRKYVFGKDSQALTKSLFELRGEEDWSKPSGIILPRGVLRIDTKWILSKSALTQKNQEYAGRISKTDDDGFGAEMSLPNFALRFKPGRK